MSDHRPRGIAMDINSTLEARMTSPATRIPMSFIQQLNEWTAEGEKARLERLARQREAQKTPVQVFNELDLQVGDEVKLSSEGATLQGKILQIKGAQQGKLIPELRIAGFDHTGGKAGGQHVFFPVDTHPVAEVISRAYRITPEDKLIAALAGVGEETWIGAGNTYRETQRRRYANKAARVKALVKEHVFS